MLQISDSAWISCWQPNDKSKLKRFNIQNETVKEDAYKKPTFTIQTEPCFISKGHSSFVLTASPWHKNLFVKILLETI